jgi:hypothetical protein
MQTEAVSLGVQAAAHDELGTRVGAAYARHVSAALKSTQPISHIQVIENRLGAISGRRAARPPFE